MANFPGPGDLTGVRDRENDGVMVQCSKRHSGLDPKSRILRLG